LNSSETLLSEPQHAILVFIMEIAAPKNSQKDKPQQDVFRRLDAPQTLLGNGHFILNHSKRRQGAQIRPENPSR
jgi:hypothetical protein